MAVRRIAVTGGPGAGKTTLWRAIADAYATRVVAVPEVATLLFAAKSALTRSLDRPYAFSYGCLVASSSLIWQLATTAAWERFASLLL